ncbi:MAG: S9 family peptidase [Planctomycetota bacterium]|nr:MAG: S9 family peptidase [Planctomycetota bacterium]REJ87592.1 MAG: S9 family peptidase [Planctomycetota bacterium]REK17640.1 MAG: S9 family peptidase [Planctomycetota bacterium]REK43331.1 MAG: S9 family peptidase [Planctomycetota bacterium]
MPMYPRFRTCCAIGLVALAALGCEPAAERSLPDAADTETPDATETAATTDAPAASTPAAAQSADPYNEASPAMSLIPRRVFFGNPDKVGLQISPDGKQLSYLAPLDGVLNVWVAPRDDLAAARPVTHDKHRGVRSFSWAFTNRHILYSQDKDGDENWRVYAIDLETDEAEDITPGSDRSEPAGEGDTAVPAPPVTARIVGISHRTPEEILIAVNANDPRWHEIYRVNILDGTSQMIQANEGFRNFTVDEDYQVRFAAKYLPDGSIQYYQPTGEAAAGVGFSEWDEFLRVDKDDTANTGLAGFDKTGRVLYMFDSRGRDTGALTSLNLDTGETQVIAADPRTDVGAIKSHPTENTIQAVVFNYERRERKIFDPEVAKDVEILEALHDGEMGIADYTLDDRQWIIVYYDADGPARYYHFDRDTKEATFLFVNQQDLEGLPLVPMHSVVIEARDGLPLVSYYSLPREADPEGTGRAAKPVPLVLMVHGGPWSRDTWGYDAMHQLLANRGYAVLSVNFRGSTGFGKKFMNAGNHEWAGKMHDDLLDAVEWAIEEGITKRDQVAIMGGSYGGYATLVGLTFTPDVFACGVDIVGPSNLVTLFETIPPYWASGLPMFKTRVGDHTTPEGRAELERRSPLTHVEKIRRPLLIGQGANDPRVKQSEADQIVEAMKRHDIPVTYALFPDEGHGFARPENRLAFYAVMEQFLARHLGGKAEPIGDAFEGSSIEILAGRESIEQVEAKP